MFKKLNTLKLSAYILLSVGVFVYVLLPNPKYPNPPKDSIRSFEPADTETPMRRAYFTNFSRDEVIDHYKSEFDNSTFLNIYLPIINLNYPPERAQEIIRDQTRSTYLEELVHPFRESLYINGFEPQTEKDAIFIQDRNWEQKIIIKYVPSRRLFRTLITLTVLIITPVVVGRFYDQSCLLARSILGQFSKRNRK